MVKNLSPADIVFGLRSQLYDLVSARVRTVNTHTVTLSLPNNCDCSIPIEEFFSDEGILAVHANDTVTIARNRSCLPNAVHAYSYKAAQQMIGLKEIQTAWETDSDVTGVVECKVEGGFRVLIKGNAAFLPVKNAVYDLTDRNAVEIVGRAAKFKVSRFDPESKKISLSLVNFRSVTYRRDITPVTKLYCEGDIAEGTIKKIVRYGAFIDIEGVVCLLHLSEISWRRIDDIEDLLSVNERIRVKILKIDPVSKRINVSLKAVLEENPWKVILRRYPVGTILTRTITSITNYGLFVNIEPGMQGLIHASELQWGRGFKDPHAHFKPGDTITAMVITVDSELQRIALSRKRCLPNPWEDFAASHPIGEIIRVSIRTINAKGIFVEIAPGIDGRISLADLPVGKTKEDIFLQYGIGAEIFVRLLLIDAEENKIRLSMNLESSLLH